MTKVGLVNRIAEHSEVPLTKKAIVAVLDTLYPIAVETLNNDDSFSIPGICMITKVRKEARTGRNPATGETIEIPAKNAVKVKVVKAFKSEIQ